MPFRHERVPVRTIAATIGMVLATLAAVFLLSRITRVLVWLTVAGFLAVVFTPLVGVVQRRLRLPRGVAVAVVVVGGFAVLSGIGVLLVRPIVSEIGQLADQLPGYVDQVRTGRGPLGSLVDRYNLAQYVQDNQARLEKMVSGFGSSALGAVQAAGSAVVGTIAILVLAVLLTLQGPHLVDGALAVLPDRHRGRARRVAADCARAVTGYVTGQLLIATIAASVAFVVLTLLGVPFAAILALVVGLTDLIPLVGATIGAVLSVAVAFTQGLVPGLVVLGYFVVYQLLENHLLQPVIQSRTVDLSALAVLVAVLVGVELAGILGALLAIPAAGILKVLARDLWDERHGRPKDPPTVGEDEAPVDEATQPVPAG